MIVFLCQREKQLTAVCNLQLKALSEPDCTSDSSGERSVSELDQLELVQLNYLSYYLLINSLVISALKRWSQVSSRKWSHTAAAVELSVCEFTPHGRKMNLYKPLKMAVNFEELRILQSKLIIPTQNPPLNMRFFTKVCCSWIKEYLMPFFKNLMSF